MLAALGGAAAVAVSFGIVAMFEGARVVSWMPALRDVPVNLPVLGFAVLLSLVAGLLFGLAPALTASRPSALSRNSAAGSRLRDGLVVAQLALSVTLLVGAGLLTRTLVNMRAIDVGIERDNLVFFSIDPALQGYDEERTRGLIERVAANLEALPMTRFVAASYPEAFGRIRAAATVARWGEDVDEAGVTPDNMRVTPEFFDTMGIDIVAGRTFDGGRLVESDPSRREVILSEGLARDLFPDGPVTGRLLTIKEWGRDEPIPYEVVGVARDARLRRLLDDQTEIIYEPFGQRYFPQQVSFQVRTSGGGRAILDQVREAMLAADPVLPAFDLVTATDKLDGTIAEHRMVAKLSAVLAAMALLLAGVGIYGVVATTVRMRFREIGIRIALGARTTDVLGGVLRRFVGLGLVGVVLGLVGAAWLMGLMRNQLYGVEPFDAPVFVAGAAVMLLLTVIASLVPARHATRVSPVDVLREE
jgi:predicted permease